MRRALGRLADEPTYLQHALGPGVAARERRSVRHGPAVDRFVEVLGREIEVAGAKLLNHPLDLVHARPPARRPPASAVHDPLCPVRLIGIAQPAKVPLAHPQQLRRLYAAQLLRLMQPNRIDDPGHSDLRQHAIPPVKTGQIVCYETRTYLVSPTRYGATVALSGASCDLAEGEFLTLLGPSGSGKTTLLMIVAGLVQPTSGEVLIDGRPATHLPSYARDIGMVFQSYALFPHLTVA